MKHILNNLTEEEKNSIREQHTGGKKIMIENFNKLINSKLGDSKPLLEEQVQFTSGPKKGKANLEMGKEYFFVVTDNGRKQGEVAMSVQGSPDDDHYQLVATDKYDYPQLKNGKYTYGSGIFTFPGVSYYLEIKGSPASTK